MGLFNFGKKAPPPQVSRLDELKEIVARDPSSRQFLALAEEYRKLGKTREQIDALERGLRSNPTYVAAHVSLGRAYEQLGKNNEDAIRAYLSALKQDPQNLVAIRQIADCYLRKGDKIEAIKKLKLYRGLKPGEKDVDELIQQLDAELNPKPKEKPPSPSVIPPSSARPALLRRTSTYGVSGSGGTSPGFQPPAGARVAETTGEIRSPLGSSEFARPGGALTTGSIPSPLPPAGPPTPPPGAFGAPSGLPPLTTGTLPGTSVQPRPLTPSSPGFAPPLTTSPIPTAPITAPVSSVQGPLAFGKAPGSGPSIPLPPRPSVPAPPPAPFAADVPAGPTSYGPTLPIPPRWTMPPAVPAAEAMEMTFDGLRKPPSTPPPPPAPPVRAETPLSLQEIPAGPLLPTSGPPAISPPPGHSLQVPGFVMPEAPEPRLGFSVTAGISIPPILPPPVPAPIHLPLIQVPAIAPVTPPAPQPLDAGFPAAEVVRPVGPGVGASGAVAPSGTPAAGGEGAAEPEGEGWDLFAGEPQLEAPSAEAREGPIASDQQAASELQMEPPEPLGQLEPEPRPEAPQPEARVEEDWGFEPAPETGASLPAETEPAAEPSPLAPEGDDRSLALEEAPPGPPAEEPLVSETLAELYRRQGYLDEARSTYEALARREDDEVRASELLERARHLGLPETEEPAPLEDSTAPAGEESFAAVPESGPLEEALVQEAFPEGAEPVPEAGLEGGGEPFEMADSGVASVEVSRPEPDAERAAPEPSVEPLEYEPQAYEAPPVSEGAERLRAYMARIPSSTGAQEGASADDILQALVRASGVRFAAVTDLGGVPVFSAGDPEGAPQEALEELVSFRETVSRSGELLGAGDFVSVGLAGEGGLAILAAVAPEWALLVGAGTDVPAGRVRYEVGRAAARLRPLLSGDSLPVF